MTNRIIENIVRDLFLQVSYFYGKNGDYYV
nr:MAG TPA: hypothetical protein [Bacteriophage sp.]